MLFWLTKQREPTSGEWGLSLGDRAKDMMLDHVGWSFIPLYRLFSPLSMLFILVIFVMIW